MRTSFSSISSNRLGRLVWLLFASVLLPGCWEKPLDYVEVKRIDEVVTEAELNSFLEVIRLMPDGQMPKLNPIYRKPVSWDAGRTLPVSDLVNEELAQIERPWDTKYLAHEVETNRRLHRPPPSGDDARTIHGIVAGDWHRHDRSHLPADFDFDSLIYRGQKVSQQLKRNRTPFVDYSLDRQYSVTREAIWLYRVDRAKRLRDVPSENVALVRQHWDELAAVLPQEFSIDPLRVIADQLEEQGLPFAESPETGHDANIQWNPEDALIETDPPDPQLMPEADLP